jgi:hypothetical protein
LATAYILINVEIGAEGEVLRSLKPVSVETETMQELKDAVSWKIRRLDKVRSTLTMIVV